MPSARGEGLTGSSRGRILPAALAIFAHPDDIELGASGTLLRLQSAGYQIHYLAVANGSCGSSVLGGAELVRVRRDEAMAACRTGGGTLPRKPRQQLWGVFERGDPGPPPPAPRRGGA